MRIRVDAVVLTLRNKAKYPRVRFGKTLFDIEQSSLLTYLLTKSTLV